MAVIDDRVNKSPSTGLGEPTVWADMVAVCKAAVADGSVLTRERVDGLRERVAPINEAMA